ncbi:unnamed protein product [Brassica oleracea]
MHSREGSSAHHQSGLFLYLVLTANYFHKFQPCNDCVVTCRVWYWYAFTFVKDAIDGESLTIRREVSGCTGTPTWCRLTYRVRLGNGYGSGTPWKRPQHV